MLGAQHHQPCRMDLRVCGYRGPGWGEDLAPCYTPTTRQGVWRVGRSRGDGCPRRQVQVGGQASRCRAPREACEVSCAHMRRSGGALPGVLAFFSMFKMLHQSSFLSTSGFLRRPWNAAYGECLTRLAPDAALLWTGKASPSAASTGNVGGLHHSKRPSKPWPMHPTPYGRDSQAGRFVLRSGLTPPVGRLHLGRAQQHPSEAGPRSLTQQGAFKGTVAEETNAAVGMCRLIIYLFREIGRSLR